MEDPDRQRIDRLEDEHRGFRNALSEVQRDIVATERRFGDQLATLRSEIKADISTQYDRFEGLVKGYHDSTEAHLDRQDDKLDVFSEQILTAARSWPPAAQWVTGVLGTVVGFAILVPVLAHVLFHARW